MRVNNFVLFEGEIMKVTAVLEGHLIVKGKEGQKLCKEWQPVKLSPKILARINFPDDLVFKFQKEIFASEDLNAVGFYFRNQLVFRIHALNELQDLFYFVYNKELI
jgi:hypothetical protein